MKKEQKSTVTPLRKDQAGEESNVIPMKTEVQVEGADHEQQPAKIIFITSGFGKINVPNTTSASSMALAA
jgi:hypothetical protein